MAVILAQDPSLPPGYPKIHLVAEHTVRVEFGPTIEDATHARVLHLDQALAERPFEGMIERVPAYASLAIRFDPLICDHQIVCDAVTLALAQPAQPRISPKKREVLVCYDLDLGLDLQFVAETCGLSTEAVIEAHLAGDYKVYMYGFAPGYAYLAGVPKALQLPRKRTAIRGIAAGSVMIAGPQCLVTTMMMPAGWYVLGRSPTPILSSDPARPFLFDVNDPVHFRRIPRAEYEALMAETAGALA